MLPSQGGNRVYILPKDPKYPKDTSGSLNSNSNSNENHYWQISFDCQKQTWTVIDPIYYPNYCYPGSYYWPDCQYGYGGYGYGGYGGYYYPSNYYYNNYGGYPYHRWWNGEGEHEHGHDFENRGFGRFGGNEHGGFGGHSGFGGGHEGGGGHGGFGGGHGGGGGGHGGGGGGHGGGGGGHR